jgi:hypothetical protein
MANIYLHDPHAAVCFLGICRPVAMFLSEGRGQCYDAASILTSVSEPPDREPTLVRGKYLSVQKIFTATENILIDLPRVHNLFK